MSEHAAKACGGKKRFPSERKATVAARRTQVRVGVAQRAYVCKFCKGWHHGSVAVHDRPARELPRSERYARPI